MNIRKLLLLLILSAILVSSVSAQKQTNWWYFGNQSGLNFNITQSAVDDNGETLTDLPQQVKGPFDTGEGCFAFSNEDGDLLLSGDGSSIWNKDNVVMPNATNLGGNSTTTQSGIIVPKPGSLTNYYTISVPNNALAAGALQWSEVDMTLNSGLGGIVSKNNILLSSTLGGVIPDENVAVVRKTDNSGNWWLIHIKQTENSIVTAFVWEISPEGFSEFKSYNLLNSGLSYNQSYAGELRFDPTGTRFALGNHQGKQVITGVFDPLAGVPFDPVILNGLGQEAYAMEFSPNSEKLYIASSLVQPLKQISWADARAANQSGIYTYPFKCGNVKRGSDGKLYGIRNLTKDLIVIEKPNLDGANTISHIFTNYLRNPARWGLPTFISSFTTKSHAKSLVCMSYASNYKLTINFSHIPSMDPVQLIWDWGDGSDVETQDVVTSQAEYVKPHKYSEMGTYTISITPILADGTKAESIELIANIADCAVKINPMIRSGLNNTAVLNINK